MRWRLVVSWAFCVAIALVFAKLGWAKVAPHEVEVVAFARWGYPAWFRVLMGLVEMAAALLIVVPPTRFYGAVLVAGTMAGAILTYLRVGEAASSWLPASFLVASLPVLWIHRPTWVCKLLRLPAPPA